MMRLRLPQGNGADRLELRRATHKAIAAVTDDLENLRFNRAIARIYELSNAHCRRVWPRKILRVREAADAFVSVVCTHDAAFG